MPSNLSKKKLLVFVIILLVLVVTPVLLFILVRKQVSIAPQSIKNLSESSTVAVINNHEVKKRDLVKIANEQYSEKSVNNDAILNSAFDTLLERSILDKLAKEYNLKITQDEISKEKENGATGQEEARYNVLKQKVIDTQIKNWQVFTVGFWLPPEVKNIVGDETVSTSPEGLSQEEESMRQKQVAIMPEALLEAEKMIKNTSAVSTAQYLASNYPVLTEILAINSYMFSGYNPTDNANYIYLQPRTYTKDDIPQDDILVNTLRTMSKEGQTKIVYGDNKSGGYVIKLISLNPNAKFDSYMDLLEQKKNLITLPVLNK